MIRKGRALSASVENDQAGIDGKSFAADCDSTYRNDPIIMRICTGTHRRLTPYFPRNDNSGCHHPGEGASSSTIKELFSVYVPFADIAFPDPKTPWLRSIHGEVAT